MALPRRRFLQLCASASLVPGSVFASPVHEPYLWEGTGMGGDISITLDGFSNLSPERLVSMAKQELTRLESIFSLYDDSSALSLLNRKGYLEEPPPELLQMLDLSADLFSQTRGAFDPAVMSPVEQSAFSRRKWSQIKWDRESIKLPQDTEITLNGIAQGYTTDRICQLFSAAGASHTLVNLGEYRATGPKIDGNPWIVGLRDPSALWRVNSHVPLINGAIATSSNATPLGAHILDPETHAPPNHFKSVSVTAPSATLADGLSTALFVLPLEQAIDVVTLNEQTGAQFTMRDDQIRSYGFWPKYEI